MGITMTLRALCLATAVSVLGGSLLGACSVTDFTPAEKEMLDTMGGSAYQPATRELRDGIETQDLLAQASFWSREYTLNPSDLESAIKLAAAVRKMGNPGRAAEIAQTTRALHPDDPYLAAEYAAALVAGERGSEALPVIEATLRTAPNYARLWSLRGAALDQAERYAEARQSYGKALSITPYDPNVLANMGLSFALEGNPREALGWLERASALPGASASVDQNLELVRELAGKSASAMPRMAGLPQTPAQQLHSQPRPQPRPAPQTRPQAVPLQRPPQPAPTRPQPTAGLAGPGVPIATARKPLRSTDEDALHRLAANASPARRAVVERRPGLPVQGIPGQPMPGQPIPGQPMPAQRAPISLQQPQMPQPQMPQPQATQGVRQAPLQTAPNPYAAPTPMRPAPQAAPYAPPQPRPEAASAPVRSPFAPRPRNPSTPQPAPQTAQPGYPPAPVLRGPSRPR